MNDTIFKGTVFDSANPVPMLICSFVIGFFAGMLFDTFSLTEKIFGKNRVIKFFTDAVSFLVSYLMLFICAYNYSFGIIRWYCYVFCLAGFKAYKKSLSAVYLKTADIAFGVVGKTIRLLLRILKKPILAFCRLAVSAYRRFKKKWCGFCAGKRYAKEKKNYENSAAHGFYLVPAIKEEKEGRKEKITNLMQNKKAAAKAIKQLQ